MGCPFVRLSESVLCFECVWERVSGKDRRIYAAAESGEMGFFFVSKLCDCFSFFPILVKRHNNASDVKPGALG